MRKNRIVIPIILLILILIVLFLYFLFFFLRDVQIYKITSLITEKTGIEINQILKHRLNQFFRVVDEINIFRINKDLLDGNLPVYNLKLSVNDINHFDNLSEESKKRGYLPDSLNKWRETKLTCNKQTYDVKIKLHGDMKVHWGNKLRSYKVTFLDGSVNNIQQFNLILFEDRHLTGKISTELAKELGLFEIRDDIVVLKINGVLQGLYYLEETLGEDFFENNHCSSCVMIQTTDNFIEDHPTEDELNGVTKGIEHNTDFDDEISNIDLDLSKTVFNPQALYVLENIFDLTRKSEIRELVSYFDKEQLATFEAFVLLTGGIHMISGDNLRLAYSASLGKFYPVPRNEFLGEIKLEKGGVENLFNQKVPLFSLLSRDDEVRYLRNKKLYEYISNNNLLEKFDELNDRYLPYALSYKTNELSSRYINYRVKKDRYALTRNQEIIKKNLEYAKSYIDIFQEGNKIKLGVIPDSIAQISFNQLVLVLDYEGEIIFHYFGEDGEDLVKKVFFKSKGGKVDLTKWVEGFLFSAGLDQEMHPEKRVYQMEFIFGKEINLKQVEVGMVNKITNKIIREEDIYIQIADANNFYPKAKDLSFSEFREKYPDFKWVLKDGELILLKGDYVLGEDLVIPKFSKFVIEAGTRISMNEEKSIMSYSPVEVRGTSASPVSIKAKDPTKPFGTFGVLGEGKERVIIEWLDLSGGKEKVINGIYFSGGLSIHRVSEVEITDSKIHGNHADDGLNVKYANIKIDRVNFYDNFADQFDCDFCTGIVKNSVFKDMEKGDANGDGLDFSGSKVLVKDNKFQHFKDKGVSVGEGTKIILMGNTFMNNNNGAAIKDSSHAFFIGNTFSNNNVSINAYRKKQLFEGGMAYLFDNLFESNNKKYAFDGLSKFYEINFKDNDYLKLILQIEKEEIDKAFETLGRYGKWKLEDTN